MSQDKPNHLDFRDEWRRQVVADSRLAASQKLVAVVIADRADFSGKPFRLGHELIARRSEIDQRTVSRSVKILSEINALKNYKPGRIVGRYRYASMFDLNFKFLSDNVACNGNGDSSSWQVEFIKCGVINEDGVVSLSRLPCLPSNEGPAKWTNGTSAKWTNETLPKSTPVSTTPSISSELQRTGYKEGETMTAPSAVAPGGAPPPLSLQDYENGYVELTDAFTGQIKKPKDAFGEYVKQIKSGRVTHGHLVGKAQAQADAISELDARSRPDLARWLKEWMYDRRMDDDDNVVAVI